MNQRPLWQLFGILALILLLLTMALSRHLVTLAAIADPIRFHFADLPRDVADDIRIIVRGSKEGEFGPFLLKRVGFSSYWSCESVFVDDCFVQIPKEKRARLKTLELTIGSQTPVTVASGDLSETSLESELGKDERQKFPDDVLLKLPAIYGRTTAKWIPVPINWPGDAVYFRTLIQSLLVPFLFIGCIVFFIVKCRSAKGLDWCVEVLGLASLVREHGESSPCSRTRLASLWNWIGFLFLAGSLTVLEYRDPFYFTQDDNLIESLPMIVTGCRSFWQLELPEYNPYIYFGSPLLSLGIYALTYPPTLLSYGVARHVLGNEFLTVEVFAILHLVAGFFLIRHLCRKLSMGAFPANLAALSCVLSGSAIIMGRCWFSFLPLMVWTPVLFLGLVRLIERPATWKWIIGMGLAAGMSFHVGFSQVAIYLNAFFCLAVIYLVAVGTLPWKRAVAAIPALMIGAGLALPLVYQQWLFSRGIERQPIIDKGMAVGLPGFLLPYPLVETSLPFAMGTDNLEYMGHFYFFGGVLAFLFILQVAGLFFFQPGRKHWGGQLWTFLCLVAIWLGLGDIAGLWNIICELPVIGFINRHPLRVMPFLVFFGSVAGALMLERILWQSKLRWRSEIVLAIPALSLLLLHVLECRTAFYSYHIRPYPELPAKLQEEMWTKDGQLTGRVFSWGMARSTDRNFGLLLGLDLPSVYRLPTLGGYSPLVGGKPQVEQVFKNLANDPQRALRAYGVRWHFSHTADRRPPLTTTLSTVWRMEVERWDKHDIRFEPNKLRPKVFEEDGVLVTELADVQPLAFPAHIPWRSLPLELSGVGMDVDLENVAVLLGFGQEDSVVVNFLYYPGVIRTYVDGKPVECEADEWQRIKVRIPRGAKKIAVRYRPPWEFGLGLGLAMAAFGLLGWWVIARRGIAD